MERITENIDRTVDDDIKFIFVDTEKEIRCPHVIHLGGKPKRCNRLLMKGEIKTIEIVCPSCKGKINIKQQT
ncbi:MAG: hypothetical protein KAS32_30845 [Candidatus Peribacteraceae bacterium]|nr:hypothetical protein [Candidatus Peribacteraceae bacterium]